MSYISGMNRIIYGLLILFCFACESHKRIFRHKEIYEITSIKSNDTNIDLKEDSIDIYLTIYPKVKKYYNSFFELKSSANKATLRTNYKPLTDSSFVMQCFPIYHEGRIISYYFKNTKAESLLYLIMNDIITKTNSDEYSYSFYDSDSTRVNCVFTMIKQ